MRMLSVHLVLCFSALRDQGHQVGTILLRVLHCKIVIARMTGLGAVVFDMDGTLTQEGALDYEEMYR